MILIKILLRFVFVTLLLPRYSRCPPAPGFLSPSGNISQDDVNIELGSSEQHILRAGIADSPNEVVSSSLSSALQNDIRQPEMEHLGTPVLQTENENSSGLEEASTTIQTPLLQRNRVVNDDIALNQSLAQQVLGVPVNENVENFNHFVGRQRSSEHSETRNILNSAELPSGNEGHEYPQGNGRLTSTHERQLEGRPALEHESNQVVGQEVIESAHLPLETVHEPTDVYKNENTVTTEVPERSNIERPSLNETEFRNRSDHNLQRPTEHSDILGSAHVNETSPSPCCANTNEAVTQSVFTTTKKPKRLYGLRDDHGRETADHSSQSSHTLMTESSSEVVSLVDTTVDNTDSSGNHMLASSFRSSVFSSQSILQEDHIYSQNSLVQFTSTDRETESIYSSLFSTNQVHISDTLKTVTYGSSHNSLLLSSETHFNIVESPSLTLNNIEHKIRSTSSLHTLSEYSLDLTFHSHNTAEFETIKQKDIIKLSLATDDLIFPSEEAFISHQSTISYSSNQHDGTTLHEQTISHPDVTMISVSEFSQFDLQPSSFVDFSESTNDVIQSTKNPLPHTPSVVDTEFTTTPSININCAINKCFGKEHEREKSMVMIASNIITSSDFINLNNTGEYINISNISSTIAIQPFTNTEQITTITSANSEFRQDTINIDSELLSSVRNSIFSSSAEVNFSATDVLKDLDFTSYPMSEVQGTLNDLNTHVQSVLPTEPTEIHHQSETIITHLSINNPTQILGLHTSTPKSDQVFLHSRDVSHMITTSMPSVFYDISPDSILFSSTAVLSELETPHYFYSSINSNTINSIVPENITSATPSHHDTSLIPSSMNHNMSTILTFDSSRNVTQSSNHSTIFRRPKKTTTSPSTPKPGEQKPTIENIFDPFPSINPNASNEGNKPPLFISIELSMTWTKFCEFKFEFFIQIKSILQEYAKREVGMKHIIIMNRELSGCETENSLRKPRGTSKNVIYVQFYLIDNYGEYDIILMENCAGYIKDGGFNFDDESFFKDKLLEVKIVRPMQKNVVIVETNTASDGLLGPGITVVIVIAAIGGLCCTVLIFLQLVLIKRKYGRKMRMYIPGTGRYSIRSVDNISLRSVSRTRTRIPRGFFNYGLEVDETDPSHILNYAGLLTFSRDIEDIYEEFCTIPNSPSRLSDLPPGIAHKNRFSNVLPYNHSRVKLKVTDNDRTGYINASYIAGYMDEKRAYIATQAPLEQTASDFWRMTWEQHCRVIIMLTALTEEGRTKCYRYWPDSDENDNKMSVGDFIIVNKKKEIHPDYIMSVLELKDIENDLVREIHHFNYTAWPTCGIPALPDPISLVKFIIDTRAQYEDSGAPVIIHCCSGTGRSGCFITMDINMRMFEDRRRVDILNTLFKIRLDRQGCVKTKEQYTFIYKGLAEYAMVLTSPSISSSSSQVTINTT